MSEPITDSVLMLCAHCDGLVDDDQPRLCRHGVVCHLCAEDLDRFSNLSQIDGPGAKS